MPTGNNDLAAEVLEHLVAIGFVLDGDRIVAPPQEKRHLRRLHAEAVKARREQARETLQPLEDQFASQLVPGKDLAVQRIRPALSPVPKTDAFNTRLFRWVGLHWSIPVSNGYGRRLRFLVRDRGNGDRLIGIIGLCDPVYSLASRDVWVGWSPEERSLGLVGSMDAYVLGAVPPYSYLAGGKLVALLALTEQVIRAHHDKYAGRRTMILGRNPTTPLALITTTSALGRSSVYNRLSDSSHGLAYHPLGLTAGTGDFQFGEEIYSKLRLAADEDSGHDQSSRHPNWQGSGYRNRRETIRRGLRALGIQPDSLRNHGVQRQTFGAPLATNWRQVLRGESAAPEYFDRTVSSETTWWLERWALPRAERLPEYRAFHPDAYRLYGE